MALRMFDVEVNLELAHEWLQKIVVHEDEEMNKLLLSEDELLRISMQFRQSKTRPNFVTFWCF